MLFSLSKQCFRELKCFAWHPMVEFWLRQRRDLRNLFYSPLLQASGHPSHSSEARALPRSQGPPSKSCSHTSILGFFCFVLRLIVFKNLHSNAMELDAHLETHTVLFHLLSLCSCMPGRFSSPFTAHQNSGCTVHSVNFP